MPITIRKSRRTPDEVREDAVAAARDLLLSDGPQAVTLKAVATRLDMTHGNITHHFGSVGGLHAALIGTMTRELTSIVRHLAEEMRGGRANPREIVDTVFDAFGRGGATRMIAWVELSGKRADLAPFHAAVADLVEALTGSVPGRRKIDSARVTLAVLLPALGHALVVSDLAEELDIPEDEVRAQVATSLEALLRLQTRARSRERRATAASEPRLRHRRVEA
ncbi:MULTISPECIES: TetR/AcrR family transcriptional regulator [Pacificimonas]|nr:MULTISPECIES: TetR family transcriptional regulator [Pacificimonas]MBZ6379255.1 TetR/AcrR family transcriptional regulator [Pacificimonas aurantium]